MRWAWVSCPLLGEVLFQGSRWGPEWDTLVVRPESFPTPAPSAGAGARMTNHMPWNSRRNMDCGWKVEQMVLGGREPEIPLTAVTSFNGWSSVALGTESSAEVLQGMVSKGKQ